MERLLVPIDGRQSTPMKEPLLGSVSDDAVCKAHCPVTMVR